METRSPRPATLFGIVGIVVLLAVNSRIGEGVSSPPAVTEPPARVLGLAPPRFPTSANEFAIERLAIDLDAVRLFRPSYPFWQHVFTIPDGSVAFGSALDGRLLAVFPDRGRSFGEARWEEPGILSALPDERLPSRSADRWARVAALLEPVVGGVVHNATRGSFVLPNVQRYGAFLDEWGAIYERFGVPAEIGLAQAIVESGFNPTVRSEARAVGFCQWLEGNWNRLKRYTPHVIEGSNQTTQAAYCAAYLTTLATKYGSFIPALSEHHAGASNVGRTVINGERLGGWDVRERYFMGAEFALDLRNASRRYREIYRTYGPRSFRYSEMVFGNTLNVVDLKSELPQKEIHAMRVDRATPLEEITRRTGLSVDDVRRFNPALIRQVPANATLYLPSYDEQFGPDVTFWRRPPDPGFAMVLDEFLRMDVPFDEWDDPRFEAVLRNFQARFRTTASEEGIVMAAVLEYVVDEAGRRGETLREFRTNPGIQALFNRGVSEVGMRALPPSR